MTQAVYQHPSGADNTGRQLFNGNISHTTVALSKIDNGAAKGYSYGYDQLNRLLFMNQHTVSSAIWSNTNIITAYAESIAYDANGNILQYQRKGANGAAGPLDMDSLNYKYNRDGNGNLVNNKLNHVRDAVSNSNYTVDIDNQTSNNYTYDNIGNLKTDAAETISNINWTVYGKIKAIAKPTITINYGYDPGGNRTYKKVNISADSTKTFYVRDAQGNVLAIYSKKNTDALHWDEQHLYGSSSLGMWNWDTIVPALPPIVQGSIPIYDSLLCGSRRYELSNHLGNVLSTISDKKIGNDSSGVVNYYVAEVLSQNDYYPGGMDMPGRQYNNETGYRYGFNGKENDPHAGEGIQDYGMRIYSERLGRFLSVDPITGEYPELSPYQFASNRPIQGIDLDGLEFYSASDSYINFYISYDTKLKKVTSGSVSYDLNNPNRPAGLDEALKNRTTCTNCIGVDASVASFNIVMKPSLVTTASEAEMKDIDDTNAVGGGGISMPTIPQNKTQERQQRKTREFSTVVGTNSGRMNAIGAVIEVGVKIAEWRRGDYWNNYMKDVKWQTSSSTPLIVNILQYGIDNNIITDGYQNGQSLSQLANYLMKGQELTKWDENNKLVPDDKLTGIGKALWNVYAEAKKEDDQNKLIERRQQTQRTSTDNTANSIKPRN